jgi:hypothetical protein
MTNDVTRSYRNDTSQRERAELLRNDLRANTFAGRAQAEADEIQGRWAQEHKATVIGAGPVQYPMAAPNWSVDPVGPEPSLGFSVDQHEAVGEYREVQASPEPIGDPTTGSHQPAPPRHDERGSVGPPLAAADVPSEVPCFSPDVERAAAIPTKPKPRSS